MLTNSQYQAQVASLEAAIAMEDRNQILCVSTGDFQEGMRAFLEKRKPRYAEG